MSQFGLDSKIQILDTIHGEDVKSLKSFITDKNYNFVGDQQNGSYSNQVSFDLSSVVSNNSYLALQNSYLLMPMSISLNSSAAWDNASVPPTAIAMKSNFMNLIDSMQLFVNNKQVVDQTTMSNLPVSILSKLEMSSADLKLEGRGMGIAQDAYTGVIYSASAGLTGDGYINTQQVAGSATNALTVAGLNDGFAKRNAAFVNCSAIASNSQTLPAIGTVAANRVAACRDQGAPYFSSGTTANQAASWNFIAYIPLRRMSDFFARAPLVKNSQIKLVCNLNLGSCVLTNAAGPVVSLASTSLTAGNTLPFMFSPGSTTATLPTSGTTTISINVQPNTAVPSSNGATGASYGYPLLQQCRIYCQQLTVSPNYEERILANRVKTVRYLDWYQLPINNVAAGSSFSQTVSTSIPNAAIGVVVPFHAQASTFFAAATGVAQYQSPFDAAPEQSLPLGMSAFKQLQFQVNGTNIWNNNAQFTHDLFCQEVKSLSLNGSLKRELASGLMDLTDWTFSPVAICDLGDRIDAEVDAYQSIVVSGQNGAAVSVDYKVFIGYWKTYKLDVITGQMEKLF